MVELDNSRAKDPKLRLVSLDIQSLSGLEEELKRTGTAAQKTAKAQASLARASAAVTKAVTNAALSFDELHVAGQDSAKASSGGRKSSAGKDAEKDADGARGIWEKCRDALLGIFDLLRARLEALTALFAPSIAAWGAAFDALRAPVEAALEEIAGSLRALWDGALAPLGSYLLETFLPDIVNAFSGTVAPIFAQVGELALSVLAGGFTAACEAADGVINGLLLPALEAVRTVFAGVCEGISAAWDEYGTPLLENLSGFFASVGTLWEALYTQMLLPGMEALGGMLDGLWAEHLAPLWESFTRMAAEIGLLLGQIWNDFIAPLLQKLAAIFAPMLAGLFEGACAAVRGLLETASDVALHVVQALRGLTAFLSGVFSGDWARAWEGIRCIVQNVWEGIAALIKGAVNLAIDSINALIRGAVAGMNGVIGVLNTIQITIPRWVPELGGQSFGIDLPVVSAPQIPRLAKGAVIPPNAEFLAVLGDQRSGRNLEAPEALLRQIVREEGGGTARFEAEQPIELSLDGEVFYRAMAKIGANRGARVGGAFAEAY